MTAQEIIDTDGIAVVHSRLDIRCGKARHQLGMATIAGGYAATFEETAIISQACGQVSPLAVVADICRQVIASLQPGFQLVKPSIRMQLIEITEDAVELSDLAHLRIDRVAGVVLRLHPRREFGFFHGQALLPSFSPAHQQRISPRLAAPLIMFERKEIGVILFTCFASSASSHTVTALTAASNCYQ
ncbi:hypothetical protein M9979_15805 [Sphingomonas sp. RP10(2022)]|uniref:Uncharacterized protein n=1 Tax=Sphingomonas liriopis TaxID=2949094 RepID=A0A9X2HVM2_9SPHN|nr:hypothetical protein [Sphingomonas liriopis]MCP3736334.1 hypothetical protein [Sphingomonas liriopis]